MRLLAIDTALEACSVGVVAEGKTVTRTKIVGRRHAEILFAMIEEAMAEAHLAFADLDRIAVTVGPGSFTGLRVGIAAARGLALVAGKTAVGVTTLAVHAETARHELGPTSVLAVLPAGHGALYGQLFAEDGGEIAPAEAAPAETLARRIAANTMIAGAGADALAEIVGDEAAARTVHKNSAPDIASLLRLAASAPDAKEAPRPLYLRPPDAKPQTNAVARR